MFVDRLETDGSIDSDEESTLSSLLDDLDAVRAKTALELELDDIDTDTATDIDMDETIDAPPAAPEGVRGLDVEIGFFVFPGVVRGRGYSLWYVDGIDVNIDETIDAPPAAAGRVRCL